VRIRTAAREIREIHTHIGGTRVAARARVRFYKRPRYQRLTPLEEEREPTVLVDPSLYIEYAPRFVRGKRKPTPSCVGAYCELDG
jgi:hypothetical protein